LEDPQELIDVLTSIKKRLIRSRTVSKRAAQVGREEEERRIFE
jgi:hypothetical protein